MSEWNRVYQGGHHDVWCDGKTHKATEGGFVWEQRSEPGRLIRREFPCDCPYWKRFWGITE